VTLPFSLWTSCWLTLQCFTKAHTDGELGDIGFSGTFTGGFMQDVPCFGIVDWYFLQIFYQY
jgi:hypothetical protein